MAKPTPNKVTPEMLDTIVDLIRDGHSVTAACREVGITKNTFKYWREKGGGLAEAAEEAIRDTDAVVRLLGRRGLIKLLANDNIAAIRMVEESNWKSAPEGTDAQSAVETIRNLLQQGGK